MCADPETDWGMLGKVLRLSVLQVFFFFFFKYRLTFFLFWLYWVFVAACRLSLVLESWGCSLAVV